MKKQKFLQLQFSLLLLVCTLLPDFFSVVGLPDFNIPEFCCKLIGIVGAGTALWSLHQQSPNLPPLLLGSAGGGILIALLSLVPSFPDWLSILGFLALLVAVFTNANSLGIRWRTTGSEGAYLVLLAVLLHVYHNIGDSVTTGIAALVGLGLYFIGLGKLSQAVDFTGAKGISRLKTAVILAIVAVVFDWIPFLGGIISSILLILAFVLEFLGYGNLKQSASLGAAGQAGAGRLRISMILLFISAIIGLMPLTDTVVGILAIVALWLVFQGWNLILQGLDR